MTIVTDCGHLNIPGLTPIARRIVGDFTYGTIKDAIDFLGFVAGPEYDSLVGTTVDNNVGAKLKHRICKKKTMT